MTPTFIVVGTGAADVARTTESIRSQVPFAEATVVVCADADETPWATVDDGVVVLARAGDRLCAGGVTALVEALANADVAVGGFRIAGRGHWGIDVAAPSISTAQDLASWAVAPPFELSALAIWRHALPAAIQPAPGLPGGELSLLHAILSNSQRPAASISEIVAEVRIRPEHAGDEQALLRRLHGVLRGPLGNETTVASKVRRRALSLAYLESDPRLSTTFDADAWWGPSVNGADADANMAVLRDLHWVLACLVESYKIHEIGLDGLAEYAVSDLTADLPPDLLSLITTVESLHLRVGELSDTVQWLHEEVRHRDELIAARALASSGDVALPTQYAGGPRVDDLRATELARVLMQRVAGKLGRMVNRDGS